jgi:hypothetical protein
VGCGAFRLSSRHHAQYFGANTGIRLIMTGLIAAVILAGAESPVL